MAVFKSTTFQFSLMILLVGAFAAQFSTGEGRLTWELWWDAAVYFVAIYAGKEGVRYGSEAYKKRGDA